MMQLPLFECSAYMNNRTIKEILALSVKKSGLSKEDIITKMNQLAGRFGVELTSGDNGGALSEATYDKWLNASEKLRSMPIHALAIFCKVIGDTSVIEAMINPMGLSLIGPIEQKKLAWAEAKMSIREQNKMIRKIEGEL